MTTWACARPVTPVLVQALVAEAAIERFDGHVESKALERRGDVLPREAAFHGNGQTLSRDRLASRFGLAVALESRSATGA